MQLYEIIKALQNAKGSLAKQAILNANTDNGLLKAYMKAVHDNSINYYQTKLPATDKSFVGLQEFGWLELEFVQDHLASRKVTGHEAVSCLLEHTSALNAEGRELMVYIIKRSIGGSVGETMVLKTWPGLFFTVPHMRCSGMSTRVKDKYAQMPYFFVQTKMDGSFGYLQAPLDGSPRLFTRSGNIYPAWLSEKLAKGLPDGYVVMGEVLVYEGAAPLSRKDSNGILNSILQGADENTSHDVRLVAWDVVTVGEFEGGKSERGYVHRLEDLRYLVDFHAESISIVPTDSVASLEMAFGLSRGAMLRGEEGTVWKNPEGVWKNSSSGTIDAVKVKVAFQAEYRVVGKYEGEGKARGMLGGFNIESSDGHIQSNVGSGFSDKQRKEMWTEDTDGWIVTVEANDVISKEGSSVQSLFLPIFIERRLDKIEADSVEMILEQLQAAKEGT
jgi:hypothetical protein